MPVYPHRIKTAKIVWVMTDGKTEETTEIEFDDVEKVQIERDLSPNMSYAYPFFFDETRVMIAGHVSHINENIRTTVVDADQVKRLKEGGG